MQAHCWIIDSISGIDCVCVRVCARASVHTRAWQYPGIVFQASEPVQLSVATSTGATDGSILLVQVSTSGALCLLLLCYRLIPCWY
jgi:hypothetical protein